MPDLISLLQLGYNLEMIKPGTPEKGCGNEKGLSLLSLATYFSNIGSKCQVIEQSHCAAPSMMN